MFDFDRNTGVLSNLITISGYNNAWGAEFSGDGKKLYTTRWYATPVYQFDLTNYNQTAINNSVVTVGQATSPHSLYKAGYLKRGKDDKIYVAKFNSTYLGAVELPDNLGMACNYNDSYVSLGTKQSQAGLPAFLNTNLYTNSKGSNPIEKNTEAYPNPAFFNIHFRVQSNNKLLNFRLFDLNGKIVAERTNVNAESFNFYRENLKSGIYIYAFYADNEFISQGKIIFTDY
ncbi:MAG: hypothetical protein BWY70_01676 [Bacteroidetes bacterium ADurb.Bin408]|nr:MAG: hypothetical protein BWY70_01676 [Bacteroidetes bacterium ADurb.Bin408]